MIPEPTMPTVRMARCHAPNCSYPSVTWAIRLRSGHGPATARAPGDRGCADVLHGGRQVEGCRTSQPIWPTAAAARTPPSTRGTSASRHWSWHRSQRTDRRRARRWPWRSSTTSWRSMRATRSPTTTQTARRRSKRARRQRPTGCSVCFPPRPGGWFRELWDEYERGDTPEARFVMAVDRLAPMMLNLAEGASTWREHGITEVAGDRPQRAPHRASRCPVPGRWCSPMLDEAAEAGDRRPGVTEFIGSSPAFNGSPTCALGTLNAVTADMLADLRIRTRTTRSARSGAQLPGSRRLRDGRWPHDAVAYAVPCRRPVSPDHRPTSPRSAPLGLRTVIDLRSDPELDERGRFPVDAHPVVFHHLPVVDKTWSPGRTTQVRPRRRLPDLGVPRHARRSGRHVSRKRSSCWPQPDALPAVFHCAAGKDRTGLLAALLLGSLGVSHDDIVDDYSLTVAGMDRFRAWADRELARVERANGVDAARVHHGVARSDAPHPRQR